jgi:RNA polymerase sigma factor (sigma-70 family)
MSEAAASLSHGHVPAAGQRLLSDDRLARRAAAGDGEAFAALYRRHHQALYRYCRAILGNSEDAADALQNTMAAALRALPGEQREIRVKPWLYRIAHNESISLLRRRPPHTGLEEAMNVAAPPGSQATTRERLRQLLADLRELQERQRSALVMRELNGLDYGEIGAALGSTPAATKQLVYEARTALYEMVEGRDMSCDSVRLSLSAEDRRKLRGRKLRAHLRTCDGCRQFQRAMDVRQRDLAAVTPPLPAIAAAALLNGLGGGGHGSGAAGLASLAGSATGKAVATSAVVKGLAAVAVIASVATGTAGLTGNLPGLRSHKAPQESAGPNRSSPPAGRRAGTLTPGDSKPRRSSTNTTVLSGAPLTGRRDPHEHPATHRRAAAPHPQSAGRARKGSRPAVPPQRSSSRPPVHLPPRNGGRSGTKSGGNGNPAPSTAGESDPAPTGKPLGLPEPVPGATARPQPRETF